MEKNTHVTHQVYGTTAVFAHLPILAVTSVLLQ